MAFSLKSLFKGKTTAGAEGAPAEEDDPFAPSTSEEIPASEADKAAKKTAKNGKARKKKKKKRKKAPGPLGKLVAKLSGKRKAALADGGPDDPFNNPEILALIASEVASLPPPEIDTDTAEAPPPADQPDTPAAQDAEPAAEDDLGPYLEEAERAEAGPEGEGGEGPAPTAEDEAAFGAFAAVMHDDDEAEAAYFRRKRRNTIIGSSITASLLVVLALGGWWLAGQFGGGTGDDMPGTGGGLQVHSDVDRMAPPQQAQSGDRIAMALPPPPSAETAETDPDAPTEKSLSRRPWLNEGGPVSGQTEGDGSSSGEGPAVSPPPEAAAHTEAEAHTEAPAETEPTDDAISPTDHAAVPSDAPEAPPATAEGQEDTPSVPDTTRARPQLAGLPPLEEPRRPPAPADAPAVPRFASLPQTGSPQGLGEAPVTGLYRQGPFGPLPVKAADGREAWQVYARPFDGTGPRVVLIVTGLGLNPEATEAAISRLPPQVTLAFSPYAPSLDAQVRKARSYGHEVLLDLPMEPEGFPAQDPGPLAMLTALSQNDNLTRLETILGKATGYTGLVGRFGGKYGASRVHMRTVLQALAERGLLYVHTAAAEGVRDNADLAVPQAESLLTVDEHPFREAIDARLAYLAEAAKIRGIAVGIAHPYPVTFERLARFAGDAAKLGVSLAPASASARLPTTAATAPDGGGPG